MLIHGVVDPVSGQSSDEIYSVHTDSLHPKLNLSFYTITITAKDSPNSTIIVVMIQARVLEYSSTEGALVPLSSCKFLSDIFDVLRLELFQLCQLGSSFSEKAEIRRGYTPTAARRYS
jgi:hypothetical protein